VIHWYETVKLEPGTEDAYYEAVEHRLLPYLDGAQDGTRSACGVFKVDNNYSEWPTMVALWAYPDWTAYAASRARADGTKGVRLNLSGPFQWNLDAAKWRRSAFTRVLVPLPFSPMPPMRPDTCSAGAIFLSQTIEVRPGHAAAFVAAMQDEVLPRAGDGGLTLEAFWRVAAQPLEYEVLWSTPGWEAYAALQEGRDIAVESSHLQGMEDAWRCIVGFRERTLIPTHFSPLGGRG
jgi:hypothetical protein